MESLTLPIADTPADVSPGWLTAVQRPVCLSRVLNNPKTAVFGHLHNGLHVRGLPVEMNGHDAHRPRADRRI